MANYFVMQVDSLVRTFSVMDTGKCIQFGMEAQDHGAVLAEPETGDWILGYVTAPVNEIRLVFQVAGKENGDRLELVKKMEVEAGVRVGDPALEEWIARNHLSGLTETRFREICGRLVEGQKLELPVEEEPAGTAGDGSGDREEGSPCLTSGELPAGQVPDNGAGAMGSESGLAHGGSREILGTSGSLLETSAGVTAPRLPVPWNYLVFGAPGTGKSHLVSRMQKKYFPDEDSFERVTFYASYSYANFVGTYKPRMEGKDIGYGFVPGPWVRVLEKAIRHPERNFLLIVEEINRANAAAVLGDMFQLLDRKTGKSQYPVSTSEDLKQYLASGYYEDFQERPELQKQYLDSFGKLLIPSNMYLWATMNSADQGVFPMDTAFKRRWDFRYMGVDEEEGQVDHVHFLAPGGEGNQERVSWNRLRRAVNARLSKECRVNEDKLLGPFFLSGGILETEEGSGLVKDNPGFLEAFKSKILMYLFEDGARQKRPQMFAGCEDHSRYSAVCEAFDRVGVRIFGEQVHEEAVVPEE